MPPSLQLSGSPFLVATSLLLAENHLFAPLHRWQLPVLPGDFPGSFSVLKALIQAIQVPLTSRSPHHLLQGPLCAIFLSTGL